MYHAAFRPAVAVGLAAAAVATIWFLLELVQGLHGPLLVASAIAEVGGFLVVFVYARQRGRAGVLGVRPVPLRFLAAALLIGVAAWYPSALFVNWLFPPSETTRVVEAVVEQSPLVPTLLALAVLPAIGEELVFRGVLARGLATVLAQPAAIAISAVAFSAFHMGSVAQMVGVFPLAVFLGYVALRAGSVAPTMVMHFTNNTVVLLFTRGQLPGMRWMDHHRDAWLAITCVLTAGGLALSWKEATA